MRDSRGSWASDRTGALCDSQGSTLNAFNQLTSSGGPGTAFPATTNAWDLNGNLLTETKSPSGLPPEVTTYSWDKDNRLRSVTAPTGTPTTYRYGSNGLRTERIDAIGNTRYLLDGSMVLEELDGTNAHTTPFLNNPQIIDEVLAYQRGSATAYPLQDRLGSVYANTDGTGGVVHRYDFDAYGTRVDLGGSGASIENGYSGRRHDNNGVVDNGNRQRRPEQGSWLQPDRMGPLDGTNRYGYVNANPVMFTDPTGNYRTTLDPLALNHPAAFVMLLVDLGAIGTGLAVIALAALGVESHRDFEACDKAQPRGRQRQYFRALTPEDEADLGGSGGRVIQSNAARGTSSSPDLFEALAQYARQEGMHQHIMGATRDSIYVSASGTEAIARSIALDQGYTRKYVRITTTRIPWPGSPLEDEYLFFWQLGGWVGEHLSKPIRVGP